MNISSLINIKKWIDLTFIEPPCEKNKSFIYNLCKIFLRYIIIQIKVKIFNRKNLHVYLMDSINYNNLNNSQMSYHYTLKQDCIQLCT